MNNNKSSFFEILQYYYNIILSKGTVIKVMILFLISLTFIFVLSLCLIASSGGSVYENGWVTLLHLLDPGVISSDDATGTYLAIMLVATLGGMILFGTLIGIINEGISSRLSNMNAVNYRIIEKNHIIIIGFNEEVFFIVKELVGYNNEKRSAGKKPDVIVIVDDAHSVHEMSGMMEASLGKHHGTRILYRSGNSLNPKVLERCNVYQAKSIIINTGNDYESLKWIISISNLLGKDPGPAVTASIKELKNVLAAEYAGGDNINILFPDDIINHILSISCQDSGITGVLDNIMDFSDTQIVAYESEKFTGRKLSDINASLKNATVIGRMDKDGNIDLNTEALGKEAGPDETLLFLADNEYVIQRELRSSDRDDLMTHGNRLPEIVKTGNIPEEAPENVLILRFSRTIEALVEDQLATLPKGSKVYVACSAAYKKYLKLLQIGYEDQGLEIVDFKGISYYSLEAMLNSIEPNKCIILSDYIEPPQSLTEEGDTAFKDVEKEDEEVLLAALFLKDIARRKGMQLDIVAEMQKASSGALVSNMKDEIDFVNVGQISSHVLAQAVNDPRVLDTLKVLFSGTDHTIKICDAGLYVNTDNETEYAVSALAVLFNSCGRTFIGIRKGDRSILNPPKDNRFTFSPADKFIYIGSRQNRTLEVSENNL